jgi:competence protein ComFC
MEKFLNLIFIPECLSCKQPGTILCDKCIKSCPSSRQNFVKVPNVPIYFFFIFEYQGLVRECIRKAKYHNRQFAALKVLSLNVSVKLQSQIALLSKTPSIILPIPVSIERLKLRGFNQAELIGQKFSQQLHIPMKSTLLVRVKNTSSQFANTKKQRFTNVKSAFKINDPRQLAGKTVILVDDVCTTGATFLEASKTVLKAGSHKVICVAIARKS